MKAIVEKDKEGNGIKHYSILLTEDCNLFCSHCYQGLNKSKKYMSIQTFDSLNLNYEEDHIQLYGGEPTLNKELYNYILKKNIKNLSMITNSTKILTQEELKKFKHIHLSLNDGSTYYNLINNVKQAEIAGINICINLIVSDSTIDITNQLVNEYPEFSKYFYFINDFDSNISEQTVNKFINTYDFYLTNFFKYQKKIGGHYRDESEIRRHLLKRPVLCLSKDYEKKEIIILTDGTKCNCHQAYLSGLESKIKSNEVKIDSVLTTYCTYCPVGCTFCGCSTNRLNENNEVTMTKHLCELYKIKDTLYKIQYIEYLEDLLKEKEI